METPSWIEVKQQLEMENSHLRDQLEKVTAERDEALDDLAVAAQHCADCTRYDAPLIRFAGPGADGLTDLVIVTEDDGDA